MRGSSAALTLTGPWAWPRGASPLGRWCPDSLAGLGGVCNGARCAWKQTLFRLRFAKPVAGCGRPPRRSWHLFGFALLPKTGTVTGMHATGKNPETTPVPGWRRSGAALNRMGFNNDGPKR